MHEFLRLNAAFGAAIVATPHFTRSGFQPHDQPDSDPETVAARNTLRRKGWSYRAAAPQLGVSYQHLAQVLNGERQSRRLLASILALPHRKS